MPYKHKLPEHHSLAKKEPHIIDDTREFPENFSMTMDTLPPLNIKDSSGEESQHDPSWVSRSQETVDGRIIRNNPVTGYDSDDRMVTNPHEVQSAGPSGATANVPGTSGQKVITDVIDERPYFIDGHIYNFIQGKDLIYGKGPQIIKYVKEKGKFLNLGDTYNDRIISLILMDHKGKTVLSAQHVFNGYEKIFSKSLKINNFNEFNSYRYRYPSVTTDFYEYMQNPESHYYSMRPSRVAGESKGSEGGYVSMDASKSGLSPLKLESVSRRSKGLLESTLFNGGKIFFLLDDINMQQIINKDDGLAGSNTVAANELRWLYRHQNDVNSMQGKIIFLKDNKEVRAPWKQNPDLWFKYKPISHE